MLQPSQQCVTYPCMLLNGSTLHPSNPRAAGVEVVTCVSHTLYNTEDVCARNGNKPPLTYKSFEKAITALGPPAAPAPDAPARLPPMHAAAGSAGAGEAAVPTLAELGYPPQATTSIKVHAAAQSMKPSRKASQCRASRMRPLACSLLQHPCIQEA